MSVYRPSGRYAGPLSGGHDPTGRKASPGYGNGSVQPQRFRSRNMLPGEIQSIGNYKLIRTIGKGNFAKVKLAKHMTTGRQVAIKVIDRMQLSPSGIQKLFREVRIMKALDHPNIVKLFEVIETERYLYLVMEYASGGEIFDYLASNGRMKEKDARTKFRQMISAVHYCHQKFIIHRDLKAENLLLDQDMNIKIADFGFSNEYSFENKLDTFCGSPPYAAPELFQGRKYTGPEVDVWSLGVILYTLASGSLPFDGSNLKELRERVIKGKYRVPFYLSTDCESLLKKFLVVNPTKRITLEAAMKDKWLNAGFEGEELQPHIEPEQRLNETRIVTMLEMGFAREQIDESLSMHRFDDVYATYHLLGLRLSQLETSSAYSWSSISLGRTQSMNRYGNSPSASAANRIPSHPGTVNSSLSRPHPRVATTPRQDGAPVDRNNDFAQHGVSSKSPVSTSFRQRSIDDVLERSNTARMVRSPFSNDTTPRSGAQPPPSSSDNHPTPGSRPSPRDHQMFARGTPQRSTGYTQRLPPPPLAHQPFDIDHHHHLPSLASAATPNHVSSSERQSRFRKLSKSPSSSRDDLDERTIPTNAQLDNSHLTGLPELTGALPSSAAWKSPGTHSYGGPNAATPTSQTPFTRNVFTRQTVHGGTVRDRLVEPKTSNYQEPVQEPISSRVGRPSFFKNLAAKFSTKR